MIVVLHAFSRKSDGDALLLDLTIDHLRRAGVDLAGCVVFALDAASFTDLPRVHQFGTVGGPRLSPQLVAATARSVGAGLIYLSRGALPIGALARAIYEADGIVGVGGGGIRADGFMSSMGVLINHVPQLALASQASSPSVYLPQSIGPLRGPAGRAVRRLLSGIDLVCARDDETVRELTPGANIRRYPDLAVMRVAEAFDPSRATLGSDGDVIIAARRLPGTPRYEERLRRLRDLFPRAKWAVQTTGHGLRDDGRFYRALGVTPVGRLADVLAAARPGAVVSVRLHGALQALIAGWPAVHIAYQRKGWGAYGDLGLTDYVHAAGSFEPEIVAGQVEGLQRDSSDFWSRVASRADGIRGASSSLVDDLRSYLTPA